MNMHQLALEICAREGKKKQVNIAQTKEILKVLVEILSEYESQCLYATGYMVILLDRIEKVRSKNEAKKKPKGKRK